MSKGDDWFLNLVRQRLRSRSEIQHAERSSKMTRAAPCLASSLPTQFLALRPARRLISGVFIYRYVVVSLEQCATEETLPALRYVAKAEGGRRAAQMVGWAARPWHVRARAVFCHVIRPCDGSSSCRRAVDCASSRLTAIASVPGCTAGAVACAVRAAAERTGVYCRAPAAALCPCAEQVQMKMTCATRTSRAKD